MDVKHVMIDPKVSIIKENAFSFCSALTTVLMTDNVKRIESYAFCNCNTLRFIRLSCGLEYIGSYAFSYCISLEALFLPPDVRHVGNFAFSGCKSLKILHLPPTMDIQHARLGKSIIYACDKLLSNSEYGYEYIDGAVAMDSSDAINQRLLQNRGNMKSFLDNANLKFPLHEICYDVNISAEKINKSIQRHGRDCACLRDENHMTPLHILTMNPHATLGAIIACYDINPNAAITEDSDFTTPMDYAREYNVQGLIAMVSLLSVER